MIVDFLFLQDLELQGFSYFILFTWGTKSLYKDLFAINSNFWVTLKAFTFSEHLVKLTTIQIRGGQTTCPGPNSAPTALCKYTFIRTLLLPTHLCRVYGCFHCLTVSGSSNPDCIKYLLFAPLQKKWECWHGGLVALAQPLNDSRRALLHSSGSCLPLGHEDSEDCVLPGPRATPRSFKLWLTTAVQCSMSTLIDMLVCLPFPVFPPPHDWCAGKLPATAMICPGDLKSLENYD